MSKQPTKLPDWDDARHLLDQFKGHALMTVAAKVCLGITLNHLKQKEGYVQGHKPQSAVFDTWEDLLKSELNISADTANRFIAAGFAVRDKIKKLGGDSRLIGMLDQPLQSLSTADAKALQEAIRTATDGQSMTALLQEFRLIKLPPALPDPSAGGSAERAKKSDFQMTWDFAGGDVISQLDRVVSNDKFAHALHHMPLSKTEEYPFGLIDYVETLRLSYEAANKILTTRLK